MITPVGSVPEVIVKAEIMVMLNVLVAVCAGEPPSVTFTVKDEGPAGPVGVPLIAPAEFRLNPAGSPEPDQTFGYYAIVEPCTGWPDSLATAVARGASATLPPLGSKTWEFQVRLYHPFSAASAQYPGLPTKGKEHPGVALGPPGP